ncbi:hypothetical protein AWZ03_000010 [Drosophila navojoa]|uniref:SKP1 component POZ domain-containing protein n=1 Tax=Drosophila navojoa TaxID=7232 RepID=A0A484C0B1_DRONA|nr:S-phase kinase-associated protein 1 [Drosophila navojoa]TDG53195.1 hypothetical protein AWZ03_000010 [Drosophila navojoa]
MSHQPEVLEMRTSDGVLFNVSLKLAQQMGLTHNWLQTEHGELRSSDDDDANIMPLDRVSSEIFKLVLSWCHAIQGIQRSADEKTRLQQDRDVFDNIIRESNASDATIFELIMAADYLNIEGLLEAGTQHVADVINSCDSVEAIRARFNIMCDSEMDN